MKSHVIKLGLMLAFVIGAGMATAAKANAQNPLTITWPTSPSTYEACNGTISAVGYDTDPTANLVGASVMGSAPNYSYVSATVWYVNPVYLQYQNGWNTILAFDDADNQNQAVAYVYWQVDPDCD